MTSSGDGGGGYYPFSAATPQPGLPVAGSSSVIGDPYQYGKFQNFLPDIKGQGPNPMATGLKPEMFNYVKPNPTGALPQAPEPGASAAEVAALRDQLAALQASPNGGRQFGGSGSMLPPTNPMGIPEGWPSNPNTFATGA